MTDDVIEYEETREEIEGALLTSQKEADQYYPGWNKTPDYTGESPEQATNPQWQRQDDAAAVDEEAAALDAMEQEAVPCYTAANEHEDVKALQAQCTAVSEQAPEAERKVLVQELLIQDQDLQTVQKQLQEKLYQVEALKREVAELQRRIPTVARHAMDEPSQHADLSLAEEDLINNDNHGESVESEVSQVHTESDAEDANILQRVFDLVDAGNTSVDEMLETINDWEEDDVRLAIFRWLEHGVMSITNKIIRMESQGAPD